MKIIGIGNALVDVLTQLESDDLLSELNLQKGSMQLILSSARAPLAKVKIVISATTAIATYLLVPLM